MDFKVGDRVTLNEKVDFKSKERKLLEKHGGVIVNKNDNFRWFVKINHIDEVHSFHIKALKKGNISIIDGEG